MSAARTVAAAGGVVWRGTHKSLEVALVHRPRYDDWTLPKGKLADGESELTGAVREVAEETGSQVAVSRRLGQVRYTVDGTPKTVAYWAMRELGGTFAAGDEVDEVAWLPPGKARKRLTHDLDKTVLADFVSLPVPDSVVILVRHAKAGKRSEWRGADSQRPLDPGGQQQARDLASLLATFCPTRVVAADLVRCEQTVRPLADRIGTTVHLDPVFSDEWFTSTPEATYAAFLSLAKPASVTVVCSQGITIPALVERFAPDGSSADTRKGGAWVLSMVDGDVIAADYYDAPS